LPIEKRLEGKKAGRRWGKSWALRLEVEKIVGLLKECGVARQLCVAGGKGDFTGGGSGWEKKSPKRET